MNTTSTHSGGEGTSNTPTYPRVPTAPLFKMHFQNKATLAKRKLIPSLTRDPTSKLAAAPTPQCEAGGGGGIAQHSGGAWAVFVLRLRIPLPNVDISCYVLCCAYAYTIDCGGGGAHMPLHVSSVDFHACICVLSPLIPLWCPLDVNFA